MSIFEYRKNVLKITRTTILPLFIWQWAVSVQKLCKLASDNRQCAEAACANLPQTAFLQQRQSTLLKILDWTNLANGHVEFFGLTLVAA